MGPGSFGYVIQLFAFPCIRELSVAVDVEPRLAVERVGRKPRVVRDDHRVGVEGAVLFVLHVLVHILRLRYHRQ